MPCLDKLVLDKRMILALYILLPLFYVIKSSKRTFYVFYNPILLPSVHFDLNKRMKGEKRMTTFHESQLRKFLYHKGNDN